MTAADLRALAARLAESTWVRVWPAWCAPTGVYPPDPWLMAVSVRGGEPDDDGFRPELLARGFRRQFVAGIGWVYLIDRTHDDGTPYREGEKPS